MNKKSSYLRRVQLPRTPAEWLEAVMNFIFFLCGMLAVGCVVLITVYMIISGVPAIRKIGLFKFLLGTEWASTAADPKFGILPFILSSIYGTLGATLIGVPVGLLTAVFLSKAADPKVRTVVVTAIELLAGIPSVVFGLLGMQVLVPAVAKAFGKASGACLLSAIVVLSIMILPSIVSVSVTALNAVPPEYEQGSLALGATDTETWFKISIPAAKSGIAAGIVLGIGRAIGEAMAVMMVAGNSPNMPDSPFRSVTFLTTAIAKEMSYAGGLQRQALFSIALVLFVFIMIINVVLNVVLKGGSREEYGPFAFPSDVEPGHDRTGLGQRRAGDGAGGRYHRHGAGAGRPAHQLEVPFYHRQCAEKDRRHLACHPQHTVCHCADITDRIASGRGRGGLPDRVCLQPAAHRGH